MNLKLSMITDEATQSLPDAIHLARQLSMSGLELRTVENTAVAALTADTLKKYRRMTDDAGLAICSLSSDFCKCDFAPDALPGEMEKLQRLLDAAETLNCPVIRGFSFWQKECDDMNAIADFLRRAAEMAGARGRTICLEADPHVHTSTHVALAALLRQVNSPFAAAIYDPGNSVWVHETPYPDGYEAIAPFIRHVHIKDAVVVNGEAEAVCPGTGLVDYPGLLRQLKKDGYTGYFSMETHYRKASALSEELLKRPGGSSFSEGGWEAMVESVQAFARMYQSL